MLVGAASKKNSGSDIDDQASCKMEALFQAQHDALFRRLEEHLARHQRELRELICPDASRQPSSDPAINRRNLNVPDAALMQWPSVRLSPRDSRPVSPSIPPRPDSPNLPARPVSPCPLPRLNSNEGLGEAQRHSLGSRWNSQESLGDAQRHGLGRRWASQESLGDVQRHSLGRRWPSQEGAGEARGDEASELPGGHPGSHHLGGPAGKPESRPHSRAPSDDGDHGMIAWALPGSLEEDSARSPRPQSARSPRPESATPSGFDNISEDGEYKETPTLSKEHLIARSKSVIARRMSQDMWKQKINQQLVKTRATERRRSRVFKPSDMLTVKAKSEMATTKQSFVRAVVFSDWFDVFSSIAIVTNCIFIAGQLEYVTLSAEHRGHEVTPPWSLPVELCFTGIFAVEFALRVYVHGRSIVYTKDRTWTLFDGVVVLVSAAEITLDLFFAERIGGDTSFFRSMRALRVTRAVRVVRVFRFFKELRTLTYTILGSFKTLMWSAVMMVLFWYVCGVILTTATYEACTLAPISSVGAHSDCPPLRARFGTLSRSVLSLYMAMSGGIDWEDIYNLMAPIDYVYKILFLVYLFFTMFGVLNIVTGIFVEAAKEAREDDRDMLVRAQLRHQEKYMKDMIRLFQEIDANCSGIISRREFHSHLSDERALAYFEALKLDISDVGTLFDLMDTDRSGGISIEEFLAGCQRLRGDARALDLAVIRTEMLSWMGHFSMFADGVQKQLDQLTSKFIGSGSDSPPTRQSVRPATTA